MAEDGGIAERLAAIEAAQAEQTDLLSSIVERLEKLESKKSSGGGAASKKKGGPDKSKALKPSVAKKPAGGSAKKKPGAASGGGKKKPAAGSSKKKSPSAGAGSGGRVKVPDERKVSYVLYTYIHTYNPSLSLYLSIFSISLNFIIFEYF